MTGAKVPLDGARLARSLRSWKTCARGRDRSWLPRPASASR